MTTFISWPESVPEQEPESKLSLGRLPTVHQARRLVRSVDNRRQVLEVIARLLHDLLNAESCGIFTVAAGPHPRLRLEASFNDRRESNVGDVELDISNEPKSGMTGFIAFAGDPIRLHGQALIE